MHSSVLHTHTPHHTHKLTHTNTKTRPRGRERVNRTYIWELLSSVPTLFGITRKCNNSWTEPSWFHYQDTINTYGIRAKLLTQTGGGRIVPSFVILMSPGFLQRQSTISKPAQHRLKYCRWTIALWEIYWFNINLGWGILKLFVNSSVRTHTVTSHWVENGWQQWGHTQDQHYTRLRLVDKPWRNHTHTHV